jgi:hypothetical protein
MTEISPNTETIERAYAPIIAGLFRIKPPKDFDLCESIINLCKAINAFDGDTEGWAYIGEYTECTVSDFLVGAYWALADWHDGQWSDSYEAMCAVGTIFSPGMSSGPEPKTSEYEAYCAIDDYFQAQQPDPTE